MKNLKHKARELLYNYPANAARLKDLQDDIIYAGGQGGTPVQHSISDQTQSKAIRLATDNEIQELSAKVRAVEALLSYVNRLGTEDKTIILQLLRLMYTERMSREQAAARVGKPYKWVRRLDERLLDKLEGIMIAYRLV